MKISEAEWVNVISWAVYFGLNLMNFKFYLTLFLFKELWFDYVVYVDIVLYEFDSNEHGHNYADVIVKGHIIEFSWKWQVKEKKKKCQKAAHLRIIINKFINVL